MAKSSYFTQADALLRKNLTFQKRNKRSNCCLVVFPILVCVILAVLQKVIDNALDKPRFRCGCNPLNQTDCGLQYSDSDQAVFCAIPHPPQWPGLLQIPAPEYRAVRTDVMPFSDLPDQSCRKTGSCPVTILTTGNNQSLAQSLGENMLITSALDLSALLANQSNYILGSASQPGSSVILDSAVSSGMPLYYVQSQCTSNSSISVPFTISNVTLKLELECAQGRLLWRNSSSEINEELYKGYNKGNSKNEINEFVTAYDFLNSNEKTFNASIWHNATYSNDTGFNQFGQIAMTRVPRSVNLASNAYLRFLKGLDTKILFDFVQEMPRQQNNLKIDVSSLLSADLFTYVIIALFPVVLTFLVYENQNKLRIMMKMHGLGDGPYWLISYSYFLAISTVYVFFFVIFGSLIGLKIFTTNDYSIQFVFFFIYINLQISFAFLLAPFFKNIMTARVVGYIIIFGSGLLGGFLFIVFVDDKSFPRVWIIVMELFPGFALYRGLYELGQYSYLGNRVGTHGMQWGNLSDSVNGMKEVLIIMFIEWLIVLPIAYYVDRAISSGRGVKNLALACLPNFMKKSSQLIPKPSLRRSRTKDSKELVQMEKPDVSQERERVEQLLQEGSVNEAVICNDLRKVYPGRDGNPPKVAVKGLSLALPRGECFGMLGPNGAGKTSFIGMMIGLSKPSSGRALVDGKDILTQMEEIYTSIGVCPQHDLLWETLTGREHLLFYGRLKNLKGEALMQAVDESLKSVNLFYGGVGDKFAGKYSGGMKRRLSVAISLIGDPKVVYMDEPSTGLDPASRNNLWNVVKRAKRDRAIVLTTHSMEEAEVLCDRLGIFVDGNLQCIGNPKELKARYGGSFVFTMTTSSTHETEVESMVRSLSPSAQRVYHISGTQKFELPKQEVRISDVFRAVQRVKSRFTVYAWGLADTTLEDVFIKVARDANAFNSLS